jgi:hypothetical protein
LSSVRGNPDVRRCEAAAFTVCNLPLVCLMLMFPSSRNAATGEYLIHSRVKGDFACRRIPESGTIMDAMNSYLALTLSPLLHA